MNQTMWRTALLRVGIPGWLGVGLLALAAWLHWSWLPVQRDQVDALSSDVRHARHELQDDGALSFSGRPASAAQPWDLRGLSPEAAWQTVWDTLPDEAQRMSWLAAVTTSAQKVGVHVASVQYRGAVEPWSPHQGQSLWRQRMAMPIEGRYGDVRAWLGTLLNQSNLSLDTLEVTRSDTTTDQVKGRVSLSLWWRTQAGWAR